ncbi:MAG TPA: nuclear transport factor 2 family protein, partial [Rhizomicrobium sp.]
DQRSRGVNTSSVAANKAALTRIITAYGLNDVGPLMAALHDDVVWISHGPEEHLRFAGKHVGRANAVAGLSAMAADYTLHSYRIIELTGEGDVVWMQAQLETTPRRGGPRHVVDFANRWEFRDGKIVSIVEYFDSASLLLRENRLVRATG